jgi:hypothetical protein
LHSGFAAGRWHGPEELFYLAESVGLGQLDMDARLECDPLFYGPEAPTQWVDRVRRAAETSTCRVGMVSWRDFENPRLGLAAPRPEERDRLQEQLFGPLLQCAGELECGFALSCHAIANGELQDASEYRKSYTRLAEELSRIAAQSEHHRSSSVLVEAGPAPHIPPWNREDAERLLDAVRPTPSLSVDYEHIGPQAHLVRPSREALVRAIEQVRHGAPPDSLWLGAVSAEAELHIAAEEPDREIDEMAYRIEEAMDQHPYLFGTQADGDPAAWLERLAPHIRQLRVPINIDVDTLRELLRSYRSGIEAAGTAPDELLVTLTPEPVHAVSGQQLLRRIAAAVFEMRALIAEDGMSLEDLS